VWVCVCVGFVMCGCVYVWVFNVWVCVCVGFAMCECVCMVFAMCGCFDNCVGVLVKCVLVFTVFCIVSFIYIYSYLLLV
jgi:hypothetical protein